MSDTMFYGVLRMPYTMAMSDDMSRMQFYDRAQDAADRVEAADKRIAELEDMVCKLAVATPVAPAEPKAAMLEIALRAVRQHLERDEYTEAGDVVAQALAMAEQVAAPVAQQEPLICGAEAAALYAQNEHLVALYDAVKNLVKVKGRHHTEKAYQQLVAAFDVAKRGDEPAPGERQPSDDLAQVKVLFEKWRVCDIGHATYLRKMIDLLK